MKLRISGKTYADQPSDLQREPKVRKRKWLAGTIDRLNADLRLRLASYTRCNHLRVTLIRLCMAATLTIRYNEKTVGSGGRLSVF